MALTSRCRLRGRKIPMETECGKIMSSRSDSGSGEDSLDRLLPPSGAPRRKSTTLLSKTEPPLLRTGTRTIYTAGRPPWYDEHGAQSKEAFVIGLCGGSASGKTTVANKIIEALDVPWVVLLSMDSFYKVLSPEEQALAASNDYNFDHPGAFDFELLVATLRKLKQGKSVKIPVYDFTTHGRQKDWKNVYGASVIIFEGIMSFADKELLQVRQNVFFSFFEEFLSELITSRYCLSSCFVEVNVIEPFRGVCSSHLQLLDMKIFVDTDSDIRLVRRLRRDITERGRDIEGVIKQYNKFVKPAFEQYIEPTMRLADIVVPRGGKARLSHLAFLSLSLTETHQRHRQMSLYCFSLQGGGNMVAIDLIVQHVHSQLEEGSPGLRSADSAAAAPDAQCVGEYAAGQRPAHHHQVLACARGQLCVLVTVHTK
uniref:uridine/cytidine kinase n=1 Tax=Seriola dumerili TaxID=41447 RepID=A0A3B4T2Q9_SERDU